MVIKSKFVTVSNLLHFSIVFGIVIFIFSIIFHILIQDPNCPIIKSSGFEDLLSSMFSTFKLTFGHGDLDAFFTTTPVKISYTLYIIICGLMLMNLIIAIMSSTATDIMAEPWKHTLWRMEWVDEALSAEYTFAVLGILVQKCWKWKYWSHRRAGFIVREYEEGKGKRYKVYIEVFHCPALE